MIFYVPCPADLRPLPLFATPEAALDLKLISREQDLLQAYLSTSSSFQAPFIVVSKFSLVQAVVLLPTQSVLSSFPNISSLLQSSSLLL
jgi:hypothetical protein